MQLFFEFYKTHLNFLALSGLTIVAIVWLFSRGNNKWVLILSGLLLVYNVALFKQVHSNPTWVDEIEGKVQHIDLVDIIWGFSEAKAVGEKSNERLGQ